MGKFVHIMVIDFAGPVVGTGNVYGDIGQYLSLFPGHDDDTVAEIDCLVHIVGDH